MKPLAVFYHCKLSGPGIPSRELAMDIFLEQAQALKDSGLMDAAGHVFVGVNGPEEDASLVELSLDPKVVVSAYGNDSRSERPTVMEVSRYAAGHPGANVCYHHIKGVTYANDRYGPWRRCMQNVVIMRWRECVALLDGGCDTVGAHWRRHQDQQYWAGNFWWARAAYLAKLPPVSSKLVNGKSYESEVWIGKSPIHPRIADLAPHRPQVGCVNGAKT